MLVSRSLYADKLRMYYDWFPPEQLKVLFFDDLAENVAGARAAVSEMVDLLSRRFGYSPVDAYMLCSVCADLRISSIVDVPNWVVSFYFPRIVLE